MKSEDPNNLIKYIDLFFTEDEEKENERLEQIKEEEKKSKSKGILEMQRKMEDMKLQRDIVGVVIA
jgi:hypothetical protein